MGWRASVLGALCIALLAQTGVAVAATPSALTGSQVQAYCGPASTTPVVDGQPIVVSMAPAAPFTVGSIPATVWRKPWVTDNNWRLHFEGFTYLPALAARAYLDHQTQALGVMVGQLVSFHTQNPDPGTSAYGWDEGTAMRRLSTESCLYLLTHDTRLRSPMATDANVELGPRYYGPPYRTVHNHGLMANLELVKAGELLGVSSWVTTAVTRMSNEAPLAFSPQGTTWEQASAYQVLNTQLWRQAATVLATFPDRATVAAQLRAVTTKALQVERWMTEPDGRLVQIGDSDQEPGLTGPSTGRVFRDDAAGYVIGRWSWTDPRASYYTLRYGPPRRAHGHPDRGAVTWSTAGSRVLVGPGRYEYNYSPFSLWRSTAVAHNVAIPLTGALQVTQPSRVVSGLVQAQSDYWVLQDWQYGVRHTRTVSVNAARRQLKVADSYSGLAFQQVWHLDPSWRLVAGHAGGRYLLFRNHVGQLLTVSTTGAVAGLVRGSTSPIGGWSFPTYGVALRAYQVVLRSTGRTVSTTFTVS